MWYTVHGNTYGEKGLETVTCPTLVIGSAKDRVFGKRSVEAVAQKLNCPLFMYDGYGHAVYDEAPDFPRRLYEFFAC